MVMIKILPLMNAMARMTFSPMRRQFVDLVHTGDRHASLVSDFPHVKLLLFGAFLMFLMAKQKPQICLEPHTGVVGDISARLMIVNVKNPNYMRKRKKGKALPISIVK